MLLDEDPAVLIHETTANFSLAPDRASLTRINSSLSTLQAARDLRLSASKNTLKKVQRQLHGLEQQHALSLSSHDPATHAQEMLKMDKEKFRVAKEASDLEVEGERAEGECIGLERTLRELGERGSGGGAWASEVGSQGQLDALTLKLYRSLGIHMDMDDQGRYSRAVARSGENGEVTVVDFGRGHNLGQSTKQLWAAV